MTASRLTITTSQLDHNRQSEATDLVPNSSEMRTFRNVASCHATDDGALDCAWPNAARENVSK